MLTAVHHGRFLMLVGGYPFEDTAGQPQTAVRKIVSGDYTIPSDVPLSDSCLDLIRRIFTVQPLQRITIAEIKQHPWFVRRMPKAMMVSCDDLMQLLNQCVCAMHGAEALALPCRSLMSWNHTLRKPPTPCSLRMRSGLCWPRPAGAAQSSGRHAGSLESFTNLFWPGRPSLPNVCCSRFICQL